jgi:PKD repeat protein
MRFRPNTKARWFTGLMMIAAVLAPLFIGTPAQAAVTFPIKINYQNAAAAVPAGYFRDFGEGYAVRTLANQGGGDYSYGWVVPGTATPLDISVGGSTPGNGRDRNLSTDQRFDTFMHMQADDVTSFNGTPAEGAWEIALPNGTYNVTLAVGDAQVTTPVERHYIRVEGVATITNFQASGVAGDPARHKTALIQVTVADGRLTIDAQGGYNSKINFIEIAQSNGSPLRASVTSVTPANAATGVRRDTSVSATVVLPNGGLNTATVTSSTMYLLRTSDSAVVPANVNTSAGGDILVLTPQAALEPNTSYTFHITDGILDAASQPIMPFVSSFTTGTSGGPGSNNNGIVFQQIKDLASGALFSSLAFGPDNKLYVATLLGTIQRYNIAGNGTLTLDRTINSITNAEGGNRAIIGLAFDPTATADNLILWVSHNGPYVPENAPDWTGKIARLSGPNLDTFQNYVTNLPHSYKDHMANSLAFGTNGRLYITIGSNSAMGSTDNAWGNRPERLLSAAVLEINTAAITAPPLDVKTEEGGTYNPYAANAPVTIFATGVRNAYDLVWHTNGQLYTPTNGSASGGNSPGTPGTLPAACQNRIDAATNGAYTGPVVPARYGISDQKDYLFRVVRGGYYGHPNPLRCEWVMNGGNPTAGIDTAEVTEYPVNTAPDRNYRGISYSFDVHKSPNGAIEYKSNVFSGALRGKLLVVRYSESDDIVALTPGGANNDIVDEQIGIPGFTGLVNPLDMAEDTRNGNIYVVEHGATSKIVLLQPVVGSVPNITVDKEELIFTDTSGGAASAAQTLTIGNQGTAQLNISGASIVGLNADQFRITTAPPTSVAINGTGILQVDFNPTSPGPKLAILRITSDALNAPTLEITLRGLGVLGTGGGNEPSLQWILDTYEIKVNVGDPDPTNNDLPTTALLGEEVSLQRFERADNANPVTIQPLAVFGPTANNPVTSFGWYASGSAAAKTELFRVAPASGQRINPTLENGANLSFDPGTVSFGFYSIWPFFGNREVFSEDNLNTFTGAIPHHVRVYPLKDSAGTVVTNAYVVATEETTSGFDYQDVVVVVYNVRPFGSGPVPPPATPTDLTASPGNNLITLSWTPGVGGSTATSYAIYRSTTAVVDTTGAPLGTSATPSYTDAGLTNGNRYYYAVVALNSNAQASSASNVADAVPFAASGTILIENLDRIPYNDRLVFNRINRVVGGVNQDSGIPTHRRVKVRITNIGTTPLNVAQLTISGPDAASFIVETFAGPFNSIAPNDTREVTIRFVAQPSPATRSTRYGFLTINSSDPSKPQQVIELAGYNAIAVGGDEEPTFQDVLNVFGYKTIIRYPQQGTGQLGAGEFQAYGDEVLSTNGLWARVNNEQPIYVRYLASLHGDSNGNPRDVPFSLVGGGCSFAAPLPPAGNTGCTFYGNGPDWQSLLPRIYDSTISPGGTAPAEAYYNSTGNFRVTIAGYSSHRHTLVPAQAHAVRFWAARDRSGTIIPNTYIVGQDYANFGSSSSNFDYQDSIYLVSNIRPATLANDTTAPGIFPGSSNLVLDFDRTYPGSLLDKDGQTIGFVDTQRNKIGTADVFRPDLPPSSSYDATKLDIDTAGQGTLTIASTDGTNASTSDSLVNGLCLPFNGETAKFVMETRLVAPFTLNRSIQQAGLMFGPNQYYYTKFVMQSTSGGSLNLQFGRELGSLFSQIGGLISLPAAATLTSINLRLTADPATGVVEAAYSVNGGAFQTLVEKLTLTDADKERFFARSAKGCILTFNRTPAPSFTATFDRFAITPAPELTAPRNVIKRINTGGATVVAAGNTWTSDKTPTLYTPANSPDEFPSAATDILNTTADRIYQDYRGQVPGAAANQRYLTYQIPLNTSDPQRVALRLHFAELYWGLGGRQGPNRRLFDVYAEGEKVLSSFDIFSAAGAAQTAVIIPIENIQVNDGVLTLVFHALNDNNSIAAIEILEQPNGAPIANAGLDQKVPVNTPVTLTGSALDDNPPQSYKWTQVAGPSVVLSNNGDGQNVTFQSPATYAALEFELSVTNNLGLVGKDTVIVVVGDEPIVGLTATNNGPRAINQPITFNATITGGENVSYLWDFGDGTTAIGATAVHTYTVAGTYQATVTASNLSGSVSTTTQVTVLAVPPFELRINAGGAAYTDALGRLWIADLDASNPKYSNTNNDFTNNNAVIANAGPNPTIYLTERYGTNFNYNVPVPAADRYQVTLHFAEIYIGAPTPGQPTSTATRIFDANIIDLPGTTPEIDNLNLRALVGSTTAYSRTFVVNVTDGTLNINLNSQAANGGVDNAKINGIEIVRVLNLPPVVNAGPDQSIQPNTLAQLSGTISDPEGTALTFGWQQTSGPAVTLSNPNTLTPSFTPTVKGSYSFRLTATDAQGLSSNDIVTVVVPNRAPSVSASASPSPAEVNGTVTLQAIASDLDGDSLTYAWAQVGGPELVTLTNGNTAAATFVALAKGSYTFSVTVSDGDTGGTTVVQVNVLVNNRAPVAAPSAAPSPAEVGNVIQLSANATDADDDTLSYVWTQTAGPQSVTLNSAAVAQPSFTAPAKGTYEFSVTISDGDIGGTIVATISVVVNNQRPIADAGADLSVNVENAVSLNGSASSDPDGDTLSYAWTQIAGLPVTLSNATTATPSFTAPSEPTNLAFQLIVTDSEGLSSIADTVQIVVGEIAISGLTIQTNAPTVLGQTTNFTVSLVTGSNVTYSWDFGDGNSASGATVANTFAVAGTYTVTVIATNSLGSAEAQVLVTITNEQPIADAGSDQSVLVGTPVGLDGVSSTDIDGHLPLSYGWVQIGGPAVTLAGATTATPSFTAPATASVLAFQLVVTDSFGLASASDAVLIIVNDLVPGAVQATNDSPTVLGATTTLTATATGTNLEYIWDFGDGQTGVGAVVTHTYANEGVFVASVTVSNTTNVLGVAMTGVTIGNGAPIADAGLDIDTPVSTQVTLDGSTSFDPDGHTPLSFIWQQTNGTPVVLDNASSATPSFTAPDQISLLIFRLTVTDSRGRRTSDVVRVNVVDAPISNLTASGTTPTVLGQATAFTASVATGTNVIYAWNFGDGTVGNGPNVQHTYSAAGSYVVTVTASNGSSSTSMSMTIVVTNTAPIAMAGEDIEATSGSLVTLSGTGSDPDGHNPLTFNWQQMSGTPVLASNTGPIISFIAPASTSILVFELTVTDAYGLSASDLVEVRVGDERPEAPPYRLLLPMVFGQGGGTRPNEPPPSNPPADLVITQFEVTPSAPSAGQPTVVTVRVTNQGSQATGPFWVDLYINPNRAPTAAGRPWELTCTLNPCYGVAWLVQGGLQPGESKVLTSTPDSYFADNTIWPGSFIAGTSKLYAYVDSWNIDNPIGAVEESNETNNRAEILFAPLSGTAAATTQSQVSAPSLAPRKLQ